MNSILGGLSRTGLNYSKLYIHSYMQRKYVLKEHKSSKEIGSVRKAKN